MSADPEEIPKPPRIVMLTPGQVGALVPQAASRFEVVVHSTVVDPDPELLVTLRAMILADPELGALFVRFRKEHLPLDWLRDMLASRVAVRLTTSFEDTLDACQYVADEYHQLGEGYFLVSTETGKVVLVVTDEDLYDPGLLARDSGQMGQALQRLNPHLETGLVLHRHEQVREQQILSALTERVHQTALLREEGDARLRIATRGGRTAIAHDLAGDDAWQLLRRSGGTTGMFLRHFDLVETMAESSFNGVACFRSTMSIQDALTSNLSYNRLGTLRGAAPQGWVRDIARHLCAMAHAAAPTVAVHVDDLDVDLLATEELWIADHDVYTLMRRAKGQVVPVEGVTPIGFSGKIGCLHVPHDVSVETRESAGRWEVTANVPYSVCVDLTKIQKLPLVGVERAAGIVH